MNDFNSPSNSQGFEKYKLLLAQHTETEDGNEQAHSQILIAEIQIPTEDAIIENIKNTEKDKIVDKLKYNSSGGYLGTSVDAGKFKVLVSINHPGTSNRF